MQRKAFTIIELLVVVAIIALLVTILVPALSHAKRQAKILAVNSDLYQIGLALEMYMDDHNGKHPPVRKDCSMGWQDHQLPPELVNDGYLPAPQKNTAMSAGMPDRFNPNNTYKYWAVGDLYQNGRYIPQLKASLYIPRGFPNIEGEPQDDIIYNNPQKSPVTWAIFSQGPNFNQWQTLNTLNGPIPKRTWYTPQTNTGLIVRIRLKNAMHVGSFERTK